MFTRSKWVWTLALLLAVPASWAQSRLDSRSTLHITFPDDSPIAVLGADWGESTATARGGAMLLDLHTSLTLKNSGAKKIRGVTLLVLAQEVTPGGKASVTVPSLNVGPGDVFPIRVDLSLLRPLQTGNGPLVRIGLDGVLFDDLDFFGPNQLNSRRSMMVWELEARRDRKYFKNVLDASGPEAVRTEILASMQRQSERSGKDARVAHAGPATNITPERQAQFAFMKMPDSPLSAASGTVRIVANEIRTPQVQIYNRSDRPVRGLEMGWVVKDQRGREFVTGAVPIDVAIGPKQSTKVIQDTALKFSDPTGRPIAIDSMTGYLSSVEFADGQMWVPNRSGLLPTPSPEEQRLTEIYRKRGLNALIEELKKF